MRILTILNNCQKFKSFCYKNCRFYGEDDKQLEILVVPRKNSQPICSGCQKPASTYDKLEQRSFEFIPIWGIRVFFLYQMRRVHCLNCGVKVEQVPWAEGKHRHTKAYQIFLANWAKKLAWQEVARTFSTSWQKVFEAVKYVVNWGLAHRDVSDVEAIGVDEIAIRRGHNYLTLVYQIDAHCTRLLWIGEGRTVKTLLRFFRQFGRTWSENLKFICSDMWRPYLKVIAKKAVKATHILDRFHVVAKMNKAVDEVRAAEQKQMQADGYEPILKKSRWALLKRQENLLASQQAKLKDLLKYNLKSVRAYLLKEDFNGLWDYVSPSWAGKFIDDWCYRAMRSKLEPVKKVARMMRRHKPLILNWFKAKKAFSSGIVEGLNSKVKLATKKSYGFSTFKCAEIALYHQLGSLPEPIMAHRFY